MMAFGYWWLKKMITKAMAKGEKFVSRESDPTTEARKELPNPLLSMVPLLVVLLISFFFHNSLGTSALIIALTGGILATYLINRKYFQNFGKALGDGAMGAVVAIANTAAVVGFGGVVKATPSFETAVGFMT